MDALPTELLTSASSATGRLASLARDNASASAAGRNGPAAMASIARDAIFADALLSALRARLEELKTAAK